MFSPKIQTNIKWKYVVRIWRLFLIIFILKERKLDTILIGKSWQKKRSGTREQGGWGTGTSNKVLKWDVERVFEPEQGGWFYAHGHKNAGISSPREQLKRDNVLLSIVHLTYPEVALLREPARAPMIGATCLGSCWSYYWSVWPWLFLNISPVLLCHFLNGTSILLLMEILQNQNLWDALFLHPRDFSCRSCLPLYP